MSPEQIGATTVQVIVFLIIWALVSFIVYRDLSKRPASQKNAMFQAILAGASAALAFTALKYLLGRF